MKNKIKDTDSPVKIRLLEFLNYKGLAKSKFEKICGLPNATVQNIVKSIDADTFDKKIAPNFPELNKYWLLFGDGDMIYDTNQTNADIKNKELQIEFLKEKIKDLEEKLSMCRELREKDQQLLDKSLSPDKNIVDDKL